MTRSRLHCDAASHIVRRRSILAGFAALAAFAPLATVAREENLRIGDLVSPDGSPSEKARALAGTIVKVRGYLSPALTPDAVEFAFTEGSPAPCQLCGSLHDAGASLTVRMASAPRTPVSMLNETRLSGRLSLDAEPDGAVGLVAASIEQA